MKIRSASRFSILALALAFVIAGASPLSALDAFQQNARLGRGVNLLGWDAVWQNRARGQVKGIHWDEVGGADPRCLDSTKLEPDEVRIPSVPAMRTSVPMLAAVLTV
jgi:hypothetical protein